MKFTYTHPADHSETLAHIAELSRNARATWFGLIGLCVFVGVTLLGHQDADFFAYGAETQLPLVNVTIPVTYFFVFAPVLVAALYIYLHLYLMNLWDALADAPARIDNQPLADQVFPWLISHAALWFRNRARGDRCTAPRALGWVVVAVSVVLGWAFGLVILVGLWFRSLPAHEEGLTLWIALCLWAATAVGYTGLRAARARMRGKSRSQVASARKSRWTAAGALAITLACLSWLRTEGGFENYAEWIERNGIWIGAPEAAALVNANLPNTTEIESRTDLRWFRLYHADLEEANLTRKPPGWLPWHLWRKDFEERFRRREGISPGPDLTKEQKPTFEKEARERYAEYTAQLDAPDLQRADLRYAKMQGAFLPGADLSWAQMQGAELSFAKMQGAELFQAEMQGAELNGAEMQGTDLHWAQMQGVELRAAQMQGADLRGAEMQMTDLRGAEMQGADLGGAKMRGANLGGAKMQGADLSGTQMQGAGLFGVELQGADLSKAEMQDADCRSAIFRGALLRFATLPCNDLTQEQLAQAVGDSRTVLPDGLTVASCLKTLPEDVEAALAYHHEESDVDRLSRAQVHDALLCDRDVDGNLTEQPRRVGRSASPEQ